MTDVAAKPRAVPWRTLVKWEVLFQLVYGLRSVSWEIWRASKETDAVFEEMKFGETPLVTMRRILGYLPELRDDSLVYDLGCGRGRAAFLFHFLSGSKVLAVDVVPSFISTGRNLARWTGCDASVFFYHEDFRMVELEEVDVVYACALCFGPETRQCLLEKVLRNRPGMHLVTVGWRPEHSRLAPVAHFSASFSWGPAWVTVVRLERDESL